MFAHANLPPPALDALIEGQFRARATDYARRFPHLEHRIILEDGRPAGAMILDVSEAVTVLDIAVLSECRGHGIATSALSAILESAAEAGKWVFLQVELANPARRIYERLGFRELERDVMYARMGHEPSLSAH